MATPTTLNSGEPASERSVDGNNLSFGRETETGDEEKVPIDKFKHNASHATPTYPDYPEMSPRRAVFADLDSLDLEKNQDCLDLADDEADNDFDDMGKSKLPKLRITAHDVFFKIIPSIGAGCYEYFSLKITSPSWFLRAFSDVEQTVSNALWLQAHVGVGLYVFSRRHLKTMPLSRRVLYSTFGSFLFNYGSCLFWALGKSYFPNLPTVHVVFGLLSGGIFLYIGQDYLHYIDRACSEVD